MPEPCAEIVEKWQLATEEGLAHVICMPGITKREIDLFLEDMLAANREKLQSIKI
ncbi:MAG: hypothetical protein ABIN91_15265 [Mucilaginibacter sp.]